MNSPCRRGGGWLGTDGKNRERGGDVFVYLAYDAWFNVGRRDTKMEFGRHSKAHM